MNELPLTCSSKENGIYTKISTGSTAAIHQALKTHAEEFGHLPIHDQVIPWAMAKYGDVIHRADNRLTVDWVVIND